jgi:hypothetical protein
MRSRRGSTAIRATTASTSIAETSRCWKHIATMVRACRSERAQAAASTNDRAGVVAGGEERPKSSRVTVPDRCTLTPGGAR